MEVLTIVAAVASVAQLVEAIHSLSGGITSLITRIRSFPEEVQRLRSKLQSLRTRLELLGFVLADQANEAWLTGSVLDRFKISLLVVHSDVDGVANAIKHYNTVASRSKCFRQKIRYHLCDEKTLTKCLKHLESSETNLQRIESTVHMYMTSLVYHKVSVQYNENHLPQALAGQSRSRCYTMRSRLSLLQPNSTARDHGFYGWLISEEDKEETDRQTTLCFGICLPPWLLFTLVSLAITLVFATLKSKWNFQWNFKVKNRVSIASPLMKACQNGDVALIHRILVDKCGSINDQTICRGYTPLLVAIRGEHYEAVKYLLEHGANSNMPDDDQVPPLFAVAGMNPTSNPFFEQLPPTWERWFDAFRLLVKHGAAVYEEARGESLASLNIERVDQPSKTLDFFRFLAVENSLQLMVLSEYNSAQILHNALLCDETAVDALKVLGSSKIQLSKVLDDGSSALHISAVLSTSSHPLEYLCAAGCDEHINRQDRWGWTPLYYAVASRNSAEGPAAAAPYSKVVTLLQRGASPAIRSFQNVLKIYDPPAENLMAFDYLQHVRPARFRLLGEVLKNAGIDLEVGGGEDCRYDFEE